MNGLLLACNGNQPEMIDFLIKNVYNNKNLSDKNFINDKNETGQSALWLCCLHGNLSSIKEIFNEYGATVDCNNCNTKVAAPLHVGECYLSCVLLLHLWV